MAYNPRLIPNHDEIHIGSIRKVLQDWIDLHADEPNCQQRLADLVYPNSGARDGGERRLRTLLTTSRFIEFDLADRILINLGLNWRATPELWQTYQDFDLTVLDLFKPTCPSVRESNVKKILSLKDRHGSWTAASQAIGTSAGQLKKFVEKFNLTEAA